MKTTIFFLFSLLFFCVACSNLPVEKTQAIQQARSDVYDSAFPMKNSSEAIKHILKSIKRIGSSAYYREYAFSRDNNLSEADIKTGRFKSQAQQIINSDNSAAGTATIIYNDGKEVALLTCAHVVDFPDTVIQYYANPSDPQSKVISSVAIKQRQVNILISETNLGFFKILALNRKSDIAILGMPIQSEEEVSNLPVFDYPIGNPKKLQWASFIYVLGYPNGLKMVTQGLVSDPNFDDSGSFLIDALFNKGCSGGVVLAIKNGVPNFEWVGMASSVSADADLVMAPDASKAHLYNKYTPYNGNLFIHRHMSIQYGIDHVISMNKIDDFLKKNAKVLRKKGYNIKDFFPG